MQARQSNILTSGLLSDLFEGGGPAEKPVTGFDCRLSQRIMCPLDHLHPKRVGNYPYRNLRTLDKTRSWVVSANDIVYTPMLPRFPLVSLRTSQHLKKTQGFGFHFYLFVINRK